MKKLVSLLLVLAMALSLCTFAAAEDYSDVTIRIYSNSNGSERVNWLPCRPPTRTRTATSSSA